MIEKLGLIFKLHYSLKKQRKKRKPGRRVQNKRKKSIYKKIRHYVNIKKKISKEKEK
jgi:hypothetical protein